MIFQNLRGTREMERLFVDCGEKEWSLKLNLLNRKLSPQRRASGMERSLNRNRPQIITYPSTFWTQDRRKWRWQPRPGIQCKRFDVLNITRLTVAHLGSNTNGWSHVYERFLFKCWDGKMKCPIRQCAPSLEQQGFWHWSMGEEPCTWLMVHFTTWPGMKRWGTVRQWEMTERMGICSPR